MTSGDDKKYWTLNTYLGRKKIFRYPRNSAARLNVGIMKTTRRNLEDTLDAIREAESKDFDVFVGPEWSLMDKFPGSYSASEANRTLAVLKEVSKGSRMLIFPGSMLIYTKSKRLYNTMPVLANGKIIYCYQKHFDGDSVGSAGRPDVTFARGKKLGVFEYSGLKFGVEICADAGELYKNGVRDIDMQVLSSAGREETDAVTKQHGLFVCSNCCFCGHGCHRNAAYARVSNGEETPSSRSSGL